jgi:hypothetical protein
MRSNGFRAALKKYRRGLVSAIKRRRFNISGAIRRFGRGIGPALRKAIGFSFGHPIQFIGGLSLILTFLASTAIFFNNFLTNAVLIDDVQISGDIKGALFDGRTLTKAAIAFMPAVAMERIKSASSGNARLYDIIERKSARYETERVCNPRFQLKQSNGIYLLGLQRGAMSSETLDVVATAQNFGLRKAAFFIRQSFGWEARELRPFLSTKGDKFEIGIVPSPLETAPRSLPVESLAIADVARAFSSLLLDYLSPELLAAEYLNNGREDFSGPFATAHNFLKDRQKELFILSTQASSRLENSRTAADASPNYTALEPVNEMILKHTDFSRYGDTAAVMRLFVSQRLMQAELFRALNSDKKSPDPQQMYAKYVAPYARELEQSIDGQILLSLYDISLGYTGRFRTRLDHILEGNVEQDSEGRFTDIELIAFFRTVLIQQQKFKEAEQLLSLPQIKNIDLADLDPKLAIELRSLQALQNVYLGDTSTFEQLVDEGFGGHLCAEYIAINGLNQLLTTAALEPAFKQKLLDLMTPGLVRMEDQKVVGFQFYNLWGMAENFAGHHQAAMEKFTKAIRFEGDHSWALLNWGNSAFADGDLKLAKKKYFESLDKAVVPMAAKGLLVTLKKQDDFIGYFDVFKKYGAALSAFKYADRSELELFALSSACRQGKAAPQSILGPGEGLLHNDKVYQRKDFNGLTCLLPS